MNNSNDLECPKLARDIRRNFKESPLFERDFMHIIERGIIEKELLLNELTLVCQWHKGKFFVSPGGNYIVSLGSTWEGLKI